MDDKTFRAFGVSHLFHPAPGQHLNHLGQLPTSHLGQLVCMLKAIKDYKRVKIHYRLKQSFQVFGMICFHLAMAASLGRRAQCKQICFISLNYC